MRLLYKEAVKLLVATVVTKILQIILRDLMYTCPEKNATIFLLITLPNADRFSKFIHLQT